MVGVIWRGAKLRTKDGIASTMDLLKLIMRSRSVGPK